MMHQQSRPFVMIKSCREAQLFICTPSKVKWWGGECAFGIPCIMLFKALRSSFNDFHGTVPNIPQQSVNSLSDPHSSPLVEALRKLLQRSSVYLSHDHSILVFGSSGGLSLCWEMYHVIRERCCVIECSFLNFCSSRQVAIESYLNSFSMSE